MINLDTEFTDEIKCPYCGHSLRDSWELSGDSGEADCELESCGKTFSYERHVDVCYSTFPLEEGK